MEIILTHSPEETRACGEALGSKFSGGEVLLLEGDLGAGKTAFISGVARGLGILSRVPSPTFTILNEYHSGRLPLYHYDLYRIFSPEELWELSWEDALSSGGVICVEWYENAGDELPERATKIQITSLTDNDREIRISEWHKL